MGRESGFSDDGRGDSEDDAGGDERPGETSLPVLDGGGDGEERAGRQHAGAHRDGPDRAASRLVGMPRADKAEHQVGDRRSNQVLAAGDLPERRQH